MRSVLLAPLLLSMSLAWGQTDSTKRPLRLKPFAALSTSLLMGSSERNILATATLGVQHKNWGLGLGAGMDGYWMTTYPLFLQVSYGFKKRWLVIADGGINLVRNKKMMSIAPIAEHENGWYTSAQVNYKLFTTKWVSCFAGAGYSVKTYKSREPDFFGWRNNWVDRKYQFNRATAQVLFRF